LYIYAAAAALAIEHWHRTNQLVRYERA